MLALRSATTLLQRASTPEGLHALARALGFTGPPLTLDGALRAAVGLDGHMADGRTVAASVIAGHGALRCLVIHGDASAEVTGRVGRRLADRAPHALWLVAAAHETPAEVRIVVPSPGPGHARLAQLAVSCGHVVASDAETCVALAASADAAGGDVATHLRWAEVLGREGLGRRFYRELERGVHRLAEEARHGRSDEARGEAALLYASRLLFLAFLQTKGWLDGDPAFLARTFDAAMRAGLPFDRCVLRPLFFGTLNTPRRRRAADARRFGRIPFLNGGLFAPAAVERGALRPELSDGALGAIVGDLLARYRFTVREDAPGSSEAAVDPEMLGRAFEALMAERQRRDSGSFYTPSSLVARVADDTLLDTLRGMVPRDARHGVDALQGDARVDAAHGPAMRAALARLRVLDPACGSGAFLVHALERIARWRHLAGDARSADLVRRDVLAHTIFGVDRDPTAVWLCELRLWLAVAVESEETDPLRVLPLPNLDRNVRTGDALRGGWDAATAHAPLPAPRDGVRIARLRDRYVRASGARKQHAARALDAAERRAAVDALDDAARRVAERRRDVIAARRDRDLFGGRCSSATLEREAQGLRDQAMALRRERRRLMRGGALPFTFETHFADVMAEQGFTTVVGNPPWVRMHRVPPPERAFLRARYQVLRQAAWTSGAAAAGAGAGFAGQADLAALFVERAVQLLRGGGSLGLLVPTKLWAALAGGGVRRLLLEHTTLTAIEDCSDAPEAFDAVTYPSIVRAVRRPRRAPGGDGTADVGDGGGDAVEVRVHRRTAVARWRAPVAGIALDPSDGAPWILLPPSVRRAFDRMGRSGGPLGATAFGRPLMGVKCGVNDAFLVQADPGGADDARRLGPMTSVHGSDGRPGAIERALLRPVLRGEHVRAWWARASHEHIVWTHGATGALRALPEGASRWLQPFRARLTARSDLRGRGPWWALFRTEAATDAHARVVWADLARAPRAVCLPAGDRTVPLNTCYVVAAPSDDDAHALAALLNSPLAAAWVRSVAEPARGGYRRLFAWTMAMLPLPADWARARSVLAPLGRRAAAAATATAAAAGVPGAPETDADVSTVGDDELLAAALAAYRVRRVDVEPLLEWHQG